MPELTPTGAADVVRRQVRRVRRRKNLYELQRALYLTITAGALAATLLLPAALFAPAEVFAIAAWSTLVVLLGVALVLTGAMRRRWLAPRNAVAWVEAEGALAGRVRTLLDLETRPTVATGFFHPLLAAQVERGLAAWTPRQLVPRGVPRAALATALATAAVLAVVVRLASLALPTAPTIRFGDAPLAAGGERVGGPADAMAGERAVMAPGVPTGAGEVPASATAGDDEDSTLTQLSSALQENVRQQVWGKAWERVRDALARAGTSGGNRSTLAREDTDEARDGAGDASDEAEDASADREDGTGSDEWEMARAPSGEPTRRRRPGVGRHPSSRSDDPSANADADPTADTTNDDSTEAQGGAGGSGAGDGTAPDLFGGARVETGAGNGSFELSLAARMRGDRTGGKPPGGPAPEAEPDARPALAADQRRESAAHRMAVPATYEQVVREVFAHREAP